jgi:thiamine pyrophosphokinase
MTAKKPSDWAGFVARLGGAEQVTLVGPLYSGNFNPTEPTIYVDGGARFRRTELENFASISVGDGDSGGANLDVRLPEDKDYSDLAFALRELPLKITRLRLLGFWGGRLDHMLANLGELHAFLAKRDAARVVLEDDDEVTAIGFKGNLAREISGRFSVMVLEPTPVRISGQCSYPLDPAQVLQPASSHGLSNSGDGPIEIESQSPCFLLL